jgi:hypothetical protein
LVTFSVITVAAAYIKWFMSVKSISFPFKLLLLLLLLLFVVYLSSLRFISN